MNPSLELPIKEDAYIISGGRPIVGEIECLGAKNFATKAMVAAFFSRQPLSW